MNRFLIAVGPLVAAGALFAVLPGCGKKPVATGDDAAKGRKIEPWENVASRLRQDTDVGTCRTALSQLNNELTERPDVQQPPALAPEAAKALQALMPMMKSDLDEITGSAYSALDPAYLAECFLFRDAARSIDPTGLPPLETARLAFAWVCRQVILQDWTIDTGHRVPAVPPGRTLARGTGTGLERAYVFLGLLQQLGIDGCLVGAAGENTTAMSAPKSTSRGPFWAVGVRIGPDVFVFDPWAGEPFTAPDGKRIATYAQVKADPAKWKLPETEVKASSLVLVVPLSSLAPRIALLESKIAAETGVKLAFDAAALKARFPAEAKFWNPLDDRFTYTRILVQFLPAEEGGFDKPEADRLHALFRRSMIPKNLVELPPDLSAGVADRLRLGIIAVYGNSFLAPPTPRERIQRGQLQDAARDLTRKRDAFGLGLERLRALDPAEVAAWRTQANAAMEDLNAARFPNPNQTTPQPDNDPGVQEARAKFEKFWHETEPVSRVIIDRATASLGRGESAYLLALAKHEEAERTQSRGGSAADAWREAWNAWNAFLEQDGDKSLPERTAQAKLLAARAKSFIDKK